MMSEAQADSDTISRTANGLTAFQHRILVILAEEARYGLAIKRELENYYETEVNHGRLYPNLDTLVEEDLIEKGELDKRTNEYRLTETGYDLLLGQLDWTFSKLVTDDDRAADVTALLE